MAAKKEKQNEPAQSQTTQEITEQETTREPQAAEPQTVEPQAAEPQPTMEEQLTTQLKEAEDRHLRLMAEFDNYRRRTQKERESIYPDAVADTVKELLPVLDNFQRALTTDCSDEEYKKGVQMTYNGLMEILKKQGLAEFGEAGEEFDPAYHNAVMHIEDEAKGKNVISQVFQRGYKLGDRVLRYAMVQTAN
ncbi:MAG: nucleotide exchange factor GrpE [Angelakisella sp.]